MNINKIVIYVTIVTLLFIIGVPTIHKIISINNQKLNLVNEKLVTSQAFKCYYEGKCNDKKVTLQMLYDNGYLVDDIIDPKTKEVYSTSSYVIVSLGKMSLVRN